MDTYECPACGALLETTNTMCRACKASIEWQNDQPVIVTAGPALSRVAIVTLIAIIAAFSILAAILIFLVNP